jgi:hypothetical protein
MNIFKQLITDFRTIRLRNKIAYSVLTIIFAYLICLSISPLHKINEFKNLVKNDSLFVARFDTIYKHAELSNLVKELSYKEALLKLAEEDSIQLAVNLSDSTVCLYIKGVKIHETHLKEFKIDELLNKMPIIQYVKIFSEPRNIHRQNASIVKEPIVVRQAPKDTVEAALNAWKPDTLIQKPAYLNLALDCGIALLFEQDSNISWQDKWIRFSFKSGVRIKQTITSIGNFVRFRKQEYIPTITIKMPADDLRAVYRALPQHAVTVIYF